MKTQIYEIQIAETPSHPSPTKNAKKLDHVTVFNQATPDPVQSLEIILLQYIIF